MIATNFSDGLIRGVPPGFSPSAKRKPAREPARVAAAYRPLVASPVVQAPALPLRREPIDVGPDVEFSMIAATGAPMNPWVIFEQSAKRERLDPPIVIDLATLTWPRPVMVCLNHALDGFGCVKKITLEGGDLFVSGLLFRMFEKARIVADTARAGMTWHASAGYHCGKLQKTNGAPFSLNGRDYDIGPVCIASNCELKEVSFVLDAADRTTVVRIY